MNHLLLELERALSAGFRLLSIATGEEARACHLLAIVAKRLSLTPAYWTITTGAPLRETIEEHSPTAPAESSAPREILILIDPTPHLDPHVLRLLREVGLGARRSIVVLLGSHIELPPDLEREAASFDLPLPSRDELTTLLEGAQPVEGWDVAALARAASGLTISEATRAFELGRAEVDGPSAVRRVIAQKRRALKRSATLEIIEEDVPLSDVGGLQVLKSWLSSRVRAYGDDAREFGLPEPRGMLVCGVQGCGKSHVSKAAATVLGLPLVRLDFAAVFASPSPEQALRDALRAVTAIAPVVLWVDEIEKGLGATGTGVAMAEPRQVRVFGSFLTWLQERREPVFVAATANEVEHLPPELARRGRFDEIFFVDLPSPTEREEILALALRRHRRSSEAISLGNIAKPLEHFSGAELEQVVVGALFRAFGQRRELREEDLRVAAREVVPLATLYEEKVQALRAWGRARARKASADRRIMDLFEGG